MTCNEEGCIAGALWKGLCQRHYNARRKETQREHDREVARKRKEADPDKWRRQCAESRARSAARRPRASAEASRKCRSGFTEDLVRLCLAAQKKRCAICKIFLTLESKSLARMHCDHCHASKRPRGLLCVACNAGLGYYERGQRPAGLRIAQYEAYLLAPTVMIWGNSAEVRLCPTR